MEAAPPYDSKQGRLEASPRTLGNVLYANTSKTPLLEKDWVGLVQSIAGGDQLALHALYERTHRVVFALLMRIARNQETAEELILDVFHDVWRRASSYDAVNGTALGWIMNHARFRATERREQETLRPAIDSFASGPSDALRPSASLQECLAHRISAATGTQPVLPTTRQWSEPEWEEVAPGISCKLMATDTEQHRVSMLVRLAPGGDYPPHTHAGVEELHLLDGELWIDDRKLYPGDYHRAEAGTGDKRVWSESGCTCVLLTSTNDILVGNAIEGDCSPRGSRVIPGPLQSEDTYRATLVRAAERLGGVRALSNRLQVPMADLTRWLAGADHPGMGVFLKVIDILIEDNGNPHVDDQSDDAA